MDGVRFISKHVGARTRWLRSKAGQAFLRREKENEFYDELQSGDTDVPAGMIKDKQKLLDEQKRRLGLLVVLLLLFAGCDTTSPTPANLHPFALKTDEHIYRVENTELETASGPVKLEDEWYVVSADFLRTHRENQNDLEEAYKRIERERLYALIKLGVLAVIALMIIVAFLKRRPPPTANRFGTLVG